MDFWFLYECVALCMSMSRRQSAAKAAFVMLPHKSGSSNLNQSPRYNQHQSNMNGYIFLLSLLSLGFLQCCVGQGVAQRTRGAHGNRKLSSKKGSSSSSSSSSDSEEEINTWQPQDAEAVQELTALNTVLTDAYQNEDIALLQELLTDDHIHNNVFGSSLTKDIFLNDIATGVLVFESYTTPSLEWYVDGDTAIATGIIEAVAFRGGNQVPATTFRFTRVFVKRSGEWKVLHFSNIIIPS